MSKLRKVVARATVLAFHEHLSYLPFAEHSVDFQVGEETFTWVCGEPFAKQGLTTGQEVDLEAFATPTGRLRRVRVTSALGRWEGPKKGWVWNPEEQARIDARAAEREARLKKVLGSIRVL